MDANLGKKIFLKSGGHLVIDQSEALTAIDVNTGRFVGKRDLEDTVLRTNLEAVKEVVHQLRFRNIGGIIIIDLIDMESAENRNKVYGALQEALKQDKARTNILKISELGLVEMTRKRTRENLV
ncbi:MAG: ribonuclease E/G, partial [Deltaproteobacteria bacterium]|nr:ribonuclease E/G [Deltaproteobacteria bacterium]